MRFWGGCQENFPTLEGELASDREGALLGFYRSLRSAKLPVEFCITEIMMYDI